MVLKKNDISEHKDYLEYARGCTVSREFYLFYMDFT